MRWIASLTALIVTASLGRADVVPDPLRAVPPQAELIVKIDNPRHLADLVYNLEVFKELQKLPVFKEAYDTTNARRFFQLVAYFEKQLGHSYLEILDRLAGGGVVIAAKFSDQPKVLVVIQAKERLVLQQFAKLGLEIVTQEMARQDVKEKPKTTVYRKIDIIHFGKDIQVAVAEDTLMIATDGKVLHLAIDTLLDGGKNSMLDNATVSQAKRQLPPDALAWAWLDMGAVRTIPSVKAGFDTLTIEPQVLFILGGLVDVGYRTPHVVAGLYHEKNQFTLSLGAASGRKGMRGADFISPAKGPASLPLLEPNNVLASSSWHLDLAKMWEQRAKIFNPAQLKVLEEFEKDSGKFLAGVKLGKLLPKAGSHQRVVVVQQTKIGYKITPKTKYPAFALVQSMRDSSFGKDMETLLRGAGFLVSFQANLKMVEEKRGNYTLVGYRFPEDKDVLVGSDYQTAQFNFSPCFAAVKDQFIFCSTIELGRELIDMIDKEDPKKNTSTASTRQRFYSSGGADILRGNEEILLTQLILSQALAPKAAKEQLRQLIGLVDRAGVLGMEIHYGQNEARMDLRLTLGNGKK